MRDHSKPLPVLILALAACGVSEDESALDARVPSSSRPDAAVAVERPAELILNEVNANQSGLHDLVELRVVAGGTTRGWRLERSPREPVLLAELPDVVVESGELIVVHLEPPSTLAGYAGAVNVAGVAAGEIPYTNQVLVLRDPSGKWASAVPFVREDLVDPDRQPRDFPGDLQAIIDAGLWSPACAPAPCGHGSNLAEIAVRWSGLGSSPTGASVARIGAGTNLGARSDWQAVAREEPRQTFGAPN